MNYVLIVGIRAKCFRLSESDGDTSDGGEGSADSSRESLQLGAVAIAQSLTGFFRRHKVTAALTHFK